MILEELIKINTKEPSRVTDHSIYINTNLGY